MDKAWTFWWCHFGLSQNDEQWIKNSKFGSMNKITTLHLLVIANDFTMMSRFLNLKSLWKVASLELGLKDIQGRNACDVAIEMGHQQMFELLKKHGAHPSTSVVGGLEQTPLDSRAAYALQNLPVIENRLTGSMLLDAIYQNNHD